MLYVIMYLYIYIYIVLCAYLVYPYDMRTWLRSLDAHPIATRRSAANRLQQEISAVPMPMLPMLLKVIMVIVVVVIIIIINK